MRHAFASALAVAAVLALPTLLAPTASAGWSELYRFPARDARSVEAWRETGNGTLAFVTRHENAYLLFETVNESGARISTLVRTSEAVERATLFTFKGRLGVLYSATADHTPVAKEEPGLWFAYRNATGRVVLERISQQPFRWDAVAQPAGSDLAYLLRAGVVVPLDAKTGRFLATHALPATDNPRRILLSPTGELHGVRWGLDGAFYQFANRTHSFEAKFSTYWDYQAASLTLSPAGEVGVLLGDRREGCELWRGAPGTVWAAPKLLTRCPLVLVDSGFAGFQLTETGLRAQVAGGFWDGRPDRRVPFTCSDSFYGWSIGADGREHLIGAGPTVWTRAPDPVYEIVADPERSAPTGLAVTFSLKGAISEGAAVTWDFGDGETARGAEPRHLFLKPGNVTVTVDVKADPCTDGPGVRATLPYRATGSDLSARASTAATQKPAVSADDVNATLQTDSSFLPAPGGALALPALALVAFALSRRRRAE